MPHLIVRRDARTERQIDFSTRLRIGRDGDNELVLGDADSGVSRCHAEILSDASGWIIADRGSRNGTWVDGRQVQTAPLAPGMSIAIGDYVLEFQQDAVPAPEPQIAADADCTIVVPSTAAPRGAAQPRSDLPPTPPPPRPSPPAARKPTAHATGTQRRALLFAGTAVLVAVLIGLSLLRTPAAGPAQTNDESPAGRSEDATQAEVSRHIAAARRFLEAGDPLAAQHEIEEAMALDASNRDAAELLRQVTSARAGSPTETPTEQPSAPAVDRRASAPRAPDRARTAPADPSIVPQKPGESLADWQTRSRRVKDQYAAAMSALSAGDGARAAGLLEALDNAQPGYLDVAAALDKARGLVRTQAQQAMQDGARAEQAGNWKTALDAYSRAHTLDSSLNVDPPVARVREQMRTLGEKAYGEARLYDAQGRNAQAVELYERALSLLPQDDDDKRRSATARVQILKGRP